jgi:Fe-S-cluster containining protein
MNAGTYAEYKRYLNRLKVRPPKRLDEAFEAEHEAVFAQTDCLQCANCCQTTSPIFIDADIDRIARHLRLRPADFVARYLRRDADGDWVLQQAPCPFLGTDFYCAIYDVRPRACREYPHTNRKRMHQILDLTLANTRVCPAVAEIVERLRRVLPA